MLPAAGVDLASAAVALDSQTRHLLLASPPSDPATPTAAEPASPVAGPLSAGLRYLGVERQDGAEPGGRAVVVAHLYADPPGET